MVPGADGQPAMAPISGSEVDYAREADAAKAREKAEIQGTAAQTVWEDIELAGEILDEWGHLATGIAGPISSWLPLTPANRLKQRIESIQGNVAVDQLLKIKASGAGLGHIPQAQLEMLASLLGKLNTELSPEDLRYNLRRIQEIYADIVKKNGGRNPLEVYDERLDMADQSGRDRGSPQAQPAGADPDLDSLLDLYAPKQ